MINWKVRLRNASFLTAAFSFLLLVAQSVLEAAGVTADFEPWANTLWSIFKALLGLLTALGVVVDPTTDGATDSALAMTYETPKVDAAVRRPILTKEEIQNSLVNLCKTENGYKGKKSAEQLDDAEANQSGMFTKYARDLDAVSYFNGPKQGFSWCCVFVCWLYYTILGKEWALKILGQPETGNLAAGTGPLVRYLEKVTVKNAASCEVGDIVLYDYTSEDGVADYDHVGIIYKVDEKYIYVAQGNAESVKGVGIDFVHSPKHKNVQGIYRPHWELLNE